MQANKEPAKANTAAQELIKSTKPLLAIIQRMLTEESPVRQAFQDDLTSCVLNCVVAYSRKTEDWDEGYKLAKQVANLACSSSVRERVDTNLKQLEDNKKNGSEWCAPGYFDAPKEILDQLESARDKFQVQEHDQAVQILETLLATIDGEHRFLVAKPLANCLNVRTTKKLDVAQKQFATPRKIMNDIAAHSWQNTATMTALHTGQQQSYARMGLLTCMACGSRVTSWVEFSYENQRYLVCHLCHSRDQIEFNACKAALAATLKEVHGEYLRAKVLDPANSHVVGNISVVEDIARALGISLGYTTPPAPPRPVRSTPTRSSTSAPVRPARTSTSATFGTPASPGVHLIAGLIDSIILILVASLLLGGIDSIFTPVVLYYWLFQLIFHCTIGEAITKTRVVQVQRGGRLPGI